MHTVRGRRLRAAGAALMSIRTRITLVGVGIVMLVICCLSTTLFALISRGLDTDRDTALAGAGDELAAGLADGGPRRRSRRRRCSRRSTHGPVWTSS